MCAGTISCTPVNLWCCLSYKGPVGGWLDHPGSTLISSWFASSAAALVTGEPQAMGTGLKERSADQLERTLKGPLEYVQSILLLGQEEGLERWPQALA